MAAQNIAIKSSGKKGAAGFSPNPQATSPGDTVAWTNNDIIQHWPTPDTGPAWFTAAINPSITSVPVAVPQSITYHCQLHPAETGAINVGVAPQIVRLVIVAGGSLPDATINKNDSVFWFNDSPDGHQLYYTNASNQQIPWGVPPSTLPPQQPSSQVVFPNSGPFPYKCKLHPTETGTITVL